jgi:DNA-binding transcriptional LysR family regulator
MISLKQMKYFVEIVEAGSYSRASERLYIAQSALSRHVKELENELQTMLLLRDARHVEPTAAGLVFHEHCKRILDDLAGAVAETQQVGKGRQGTIRLLHSSSVALTSAMGTVLAALLEQFPGVALEVSKSASDHQAGDIEEGRADLGVFRLPILRKLPNIVMREFFSEPLVVAVSCRHALAGAAETSIAALRDEYFVSIPHKDRGGLSYLVAGMCLSHGFFPKAARARGRKRCVVNLGIAIVPASMREMAPQGVRFIALPAQSAQSAVGLIYRRDPSPLVATFIAAFETEMARQPGGRND